MEDITLADKSKIKEIELKEVREKFREIYETSIKIFKKYIITKENFYIINSLWCLGTYFHDFFYTYPFLFFNAIKASGKTRTLKLCAVISFNGKHLSSISEAVLYRSSKRTFCIDEIERITSKEKQALRELLNACYKKGTYVERVKEVRVDKEKRYVVEEFELYCPVAMANIWGMEDILSDRCIIQILEKSDDLRATRLLENFENDPEIRKIKEKLNELLVSVSVDLKSVGSFLEYITSYWNTYIECLFSVTTTTSTYNQQSLTNIKKVKNESLYAKNESSYNMEVFFKKIYDSGLTSRHLELFFPLFAIAWLCGEDIFEEVLKIAAEVSTQKFEEERVENKDVILLEFISLQEINENFLSLSELVKRFREHIQFEDEEGRWVSSEWASRALKRLGLIIKKRRIAKGREFIIDFEKAKKKILMYKRWEKLPEPNHQVMLQSEEKKIIEEDNEKIFSQYYKIINPKIPKMLILVNQEQKVFELTQNKVFLFTELGDYAFELLESLKKEGIIEPIENESRQV